MAAETRTQFLFFILFISSVLLGSDAYRILGDKTAVGRCIGECRAAEESSPALFACAARCERSYNEWEPESSPRELEQGQQRCQAEERYREKQHQCQSHCLERQRERDREREREQFEEGVNSFPGNQDEEYNQGKQLCGRQEARQKRQCKRRCVRQYKEQQRGGSRDIDDDQRDPRQKYEPNRKECERKYLGEEQKQQKCKSWCDKQGAKYGFNPSRSNWRGSDSEWEQQRNNPYYFHSLRFRYRLRSDVGHMRVLQRFSHKSHLLRGIDNYRLAILEADPSTLVVPHHSDAEAILVVLRGN